MAVAMGSSAPPPALALSECPGLGRFRGGSGWSNNRFASPFPVRCSGDLQSHAQYEFSILHYFWGVPFGYTRKDVLLIGIGTTVLGVGLKSGLEYFGVDPLRAGNFVQLFVVLGMTVGWISTYMFRVANKDMTYAQQLKDYEKKVMEKRLDSLTEAELEALMEQVEEEKRQVARGKQAK
ncbi:unnamed protein product [Spirodela intermedia]|uniref:Uncharacterized protein n=1 Tax=Spirodela intermedia TaxID=51605 RepID=A0A7I8JYI7_SPIIN|nr:unnamed protein product [Spirodela intermedia]